MPVTCTRLKEPSSSGPSMRWLPTVIVPAMRRPDTTVPTPETVKVCSTCTHGMDVGKHRTRAVVTSWHAYTCVHVSWCRWPTH